MIGAGSVVFAKRLLTDLLSWPALQESEIALMDIHQGRLDLIHALGTRLVQQERLPARIGKTTDRREGPGRGRLRHLLHPGRRTGDVRGGRGDPPALRDRPDGGGHPGPGGRLPRAAHGARADRHRQGHGGPLPPRPVRQLLQPDEHQHVGLLRRAPGSATSASATPCRARRSSWRATWRCPSRSSPTGAPGSTTRPGTSTCAGGTAGPGGKPLPPPAPGMEDPQVFARDRVRFEMMRHFGPSSPRAPTT